MNFRDLVAISTGNLWRMKLRTVLTCSGVVIAIAAFVSMLSFGAGMQENVAAEFNNLGLFNTMIVNERNTPAEEDRHRHNEDSDEEINIDIDTTKIKPLDDEAIALLSAIPGVRFAYPYESFTVTAQIDDSIYHSEAQALPKIAYETKLFSQLSEGNHFESDSVKEVLLTEEFLKEFGLDTTGSLVGKQIIISAKASSVDSGLIRIIKSDSFNIMDQIKTLNRDSLFEKDYLQRTLKSEANSAVQRFMDGYLNANVIISDTMTIVGILESDQGFRSQAKPILIPIATAQQFNAFGAGKSPLDFMSMLQGGTFDLFETETISKSYSKITLDIGQGVLHKTVSDSVKALGFRAFSYAEEFSEIQKFFFYFDMGLALIGLIALITASLGIVNTMVMSIIERKREIGVLKSLGADETYIKMLFLAESGMIGTIGAFFGIVFGWLISRLASFVAQSFMESKGVDSIELFSMPIWLIAAAYAIGLLVSLAAGYFPSARAAKIDPVEALRND